MKRTYMYSTHKEIQELHIEAFAFINLKFTFTVHPLVYIFLLVRVALS